MAFEWLERFQQKHAKEPGYAERALAAYRLGVKGHGAIVGVAVRPGPDCCSAAFDAARASPYTPAAAPSLPLAACDRAAACRCFFRPVMAYEADRPGSAEAPASKGTREGTPLPSPPRIAVVGADGFVGSALASALAAERVVWRRPRDGEVHVGRAGELLAAADVVITAHGFRVRPGCGYVEYRQSHELTTARILPLLRPGARLLHMSSASVLGTGLALGNRAIPRPSSFPSPAYATAKWEEDQYVERVARERGLQVVLLRPAVLYSAAGAGMVETLLRLARKGIALRLYPREARHHLCHMDLLAEVVKRLIARSDLPSPTALVIADPYTVTNAQLEALTATAGARLRLPVPLPLPWMSALLRRSPAARRPGLDLRTRGEILGVLHMDTVYDPGETFALLGIDPARWSLERTLGAVVTEALRS
jgi:nucleoside-diphosphate-sugar epimerase